MLSPKQIRIEGRIHTDRPTVSSWLFVAAVLVIASCIPFVGFLAAGVMLLLFVPAAIGSFLGWFVRGVRSQAKAAYWNRR